MLARISPEGHQYEFIENKNALIFKTLPFRGQTLEAVITYLDKQILKYPERSFIRLKGSPDHLGFIHYDALKKRYAFYTLSKLGEDQSDEKPITLMVSPDEDQYQHFSITEDNIRLLLKEVLKSQTHWTPEHWEFFEQCMDECT